jgi:8-oxo-dGTP pyrophosphatase MutT (NUDIX family)
VGTLGSDSHSDAGAGASAGSDADRPHVLDTRELCRTRIFSVHQERVVLPSGLEQDLAVVRHGGAVAVAAIGADGRLLVVRQYRHAVGDWLDEVVAGRLEAGEEPLTAARRELEEEAGLRAEHWREVATFFPAPGFCSERMTLFVATDLRPAGPDRRAPDDDEEIEVAWRRPQDVLDTAQDAKTLVAAAFVLRDAAADATSS